MRAALVGRVVAIGVLAACETSDPRDALPLGADSASCGGCHAQHEAEWSESSHAGSESSPVFLAMLPVVAAEWGGAARSACEGCHVPRHGGDADEGIGCVSCHAAVGNRAERDGKMVVDLAVPLAGPFADPVATSAHRSRTSEYLASPSLCGTCHEVTGPNLVDEPTLTEFRASSASIEGRPCVDCHMPSESPRALTSDSNRPRDVRSHRFVGFDPPWHATADVAAEARARTRDLLDAALALAAERTGEGVRVSVTNEGAGHAVPTGAAFLRDLWVDLEAGGVLVASRVLELGDRPLRGATEVALLTDADSVAHGSLASGETREVLVPIDGEVSAVLRGRAVRLEVLEALGLDGLAPDVPVHEIERVVVP